MTTLPSTVEAFLYAYDALFWQQMWREEEERSARLRIQLRARDRHIRWLWCCLVGVVVLAGLALLPFTL